MQQDKIELRYLSTREAAKLLGVGQGWLRRSGAPRYKVGNKLVRYRQDELVLWFETLGRAVDDG